MASTVAAADIELPNTRKRATPRRLNYLKCEQCRDPKAKAKTRVWPGERCQNCIKRGFPCSAPQLTQYHCKRPRILADEAVRRAPGIGVAVSISKFGTHQALVLLSFKCLIEMALDELWAVQKGLVAGLDSNVDVEHLPDLLYSRARVYKAVIRELQAMIVQYTCPEILSATFDLLPATVR